jgi:hypothetical protein
MKLAPFDIVRIPDLDQETAFQILSKTLANDDLLNEKSIADALLEHLAFLPLAITQASAYIIENSTSLSAYLELLQEQEQDVVELLSEDFRDPGRYNDIQNPVISTWLISFKRIQHQNLSAADYLSFMACINPRNIPRSLLPLQKTTKQWQDALGILNAYSFTNSQGTDINMHRLVHIATRNWLRNNKMLGYWVQRVADRMQEVFPDSHHTKRGLWQQYLPHALFLLSDIESYKQEDRYIDFIEKVGTCLDSDGRYVEAEKLLVRVMEVRKQELGLEHPDTLFSMSTLAPIYAIQKRWEEAEELAMRVLEICKRVLGPEHPSTFSSMSTLVPIYGMQERWTDAEELAVQIVEAKKRLLGPEHHSTMITMCNLIRIYTMQGQCKNAEELGVQVIEVQKRVLGPEHPVTLISMNDLAMTYQQQRRWEEADGLLVLVAEAWKRVLGPEHPDTLISMETLALTYRKQQRWKEAEGLLVQVAEARKRVLGEEHPRTLDTSAALALTYQKQQRWKEAEDILVQVVGTQKQVLGPEHRDTLTSMRNLGLICQDQQRWKEAEGLLVQVVETQKRVLGPDHPDTLISMESLGLSYLVQGELKRGRKLLVQGKRPRAGARARARALTTSDHHL